jgi:hypothetical protein
MNTDDWQDRDSDLSVRLRIVSWGIYDGERCIHSLGCFETREEAIAVAKWWARMGCPEIKRRRAA